MDNAKPTRAAKRQVRPQTSRGSGFSPVPGSLDVYKLVRLMNSGFVPLRRGLLEHFQTGQLSITLDIVVFITILLQADHHTGLWWGCADRIVGDLPFTRKRRVQESLKRLEEHKYIKRFANPCGRGNYPTLIHKYCLPDGAFIDAHSTENWSKPVTIREETPSKSALFQEEKIKEQEKEAPAQPAGSLAFPKPVKKEKSKKYPSRGFQRSEGKHEEPAWVAEKKAREDKDRIAADKADEYWEKFNAEEEARKKGTKKGFVRILVDGKIKEVRL